MKTPHAKVAKIEAESLLGDIDPLIEQIGSADGLRLAGAVNASLRLDHVRDLGGLKQFLENYRTHLLGAVEFPLICQAHSHASRNEFSELISLDQKITREARLDLFASASQRVGQTQLQRLRPLRDQRGLQRYIRAVDSGDARGWHTLIYGITLASFSLPLRQGLQNYAQQTLRSFIRSAHCATRFGETECNGLLDDVAAAIPSMIDQLLANPFAPAAD